MEQTAEQFFFTFFTAVVNFARYQYFILNELPTFYIAAKWYNFNVLVCSSETAAQNVCSDSLICYPLGQAELLLQEWDDFPPKQLCTPSRAVQQILTVWEAQTEGKGLLQTGLISKAKSQGWGREIAFWKSHWWFMRASTPAICFVWGDIEHEVGI